MMNQLILFIWLVYKFTFFSFSRGYLLGNASGPTGAHCLASCRELLTIMEALCDQDPVHSSPPPIEALQEGRRNPSTGSDVTGG